MSTPIVKYSNYKELKQPLGLTLKDKLPIGNIVRNHTLKGKNRGTSIKRPPDILYQGTEMYER